MALGRGSPTKKKPNKKKETHMTSRKDVARSYLEYLQNLDDSQVVELAEALADIDEADAGQVFSDHYLAWKETQKS